MATSQRVKTSNKPTLKSQGAGYSVTNRKGETSYFKSSKDVEGGGKPISRVGATGNVITSEKIKPTEQITLPSPAPVQDMSTFTDTANANLASLSGGTYDTTSKQIVSAPTSTEPDKFQSYLQQFLGANQQNFETNIEGMNERNVRAMQKSLRPKENLVNSLQGQLNTLTSRRDQEILKLEGQGRGQTEGFVGGEQARIGREAAIQAMPIQAQLAIAQDDLDSARSYASQLFQAQSQDALARYNYQKELNGTVFNFLNEEQKRIMATKEREEDRAFSIEQSNRNNLKQLSMQAIEYGQGALAGEFMRLDPTSPTYNEDVADAMGRLRKPVAAVKRDTAFDPSGNLIDMQTGEVIRERQGGDVDGMSSDVVSYAQQFADTGKLPSVSELKQSGITVSDVTSYAKQLPKANGVLLSQNTGVKPSTLSPTQEDGILALKDISQKIKELKELDKERQKGLLSAGLGKIFGSEDQQRYIDLRGEIVDLLARARTGAALTISEEKFYANQLPGRIAEVGVIPGTGIGLFGVDSQSRIDNFDSKITSTLETKLKGQGLVIQGYSKIDVPSLGERTVGEIVNIGDTQYRVLPDGTLTDII
jgi:hypothetical protein